MDLRFGSWNVRTLAVPGKVDIVTKELEKYKLDIAGLQETRWPFNGIINSNKYTIYYSGCDNGSYHAGVGIAVAKKSLGTMITFDPINERICYMRLKGKFQNISIVSFYAPTEEAEDDAKDSFYDTLDQLVTNLPNYDVKLLLGDANAKIGNEEVWKQYTGGNSLHDISNDNGQRLISFACSKNLKIMSTHFPRKNIHKTTWISPDGITKNQIDHVLIESRHKSSVIDVRSRRGAECGSDHYLVILKLRQKLQIVKREKQTMAPKVNVNKLTDPIIKEDFMLELSNRFQLLERIEQESTVEGMWQNIKTAVKETTEAIVGFKRNTKSKKPWFNEDCQRLISERIKAKNVMLTNETINTKQNYEQINKEVNKTLRGAKRKFIKDQMEKAERDSNKNNTKDFFNFIRFFKQGHKAKSVGVKDKDGNIVCNQKDVLNTWKNYFEELLNCGVSTLCSEEEQHQNVQPKIYPPTLEEVEYVVKSLKNNKAPGEDNISAELLKAGGRLLLERLHSLIEEIWEKEEIPEEWKVAVVVPLHKKGNKLECNNYRGISLTNSTYKILSKIINNRIMVYAEEILGEYQAGFRPQKSTTDQIFILKQVLSKYWEFNKAAHILFVDFCKAYDSVNRNQMWKYMAQNGIPEKLINMAKLCTEGSKCKIRINNECTQDFIVNNGVRQGDGLSPLLFNLALERTLKQVYQQHPGLEVGNKINILAYADDIALMAENENDLKKLTETLIREAKKVGLLINKEKTKYLVVGRNSAQVQNHLLVGSQSFQRCDEFKYLGVIIDQNNNEETELNSRIINGNKCYWSLQNLLRSKILSQKTKIKIYKTIIRPVVTYGSETWVLSKQTERKLITFENKLLRRIFGPISENGTWRIRNNRELRELYEEPDIIATVKSQRLRWAGHVHRRSRNSNLRSVLEDIPRGRRPLGRPRLRWWDQVQKDMIRLGATEGMMDDRERWRHAVGEAKNQLGFEWPSR